MSARTQAGAASGDVTVAWLAVAACGCGAVVAINGTAASALPVALGGGALLAFGLTVVLAGRWLEPLILLAVALPLPPLYSGDTSRISAALLMTFVVLAAGVAGVAAAPRVTAGTRAHLPLAPVLALGGAVLLAAAFGADRAAAARELVNWTLLLSVLLLAVRELADRPPVRHRLALAVAAVAAVCGALAVLQAGGVLPGRFPIRGSALQRAALGFGWPNELGMFFALALPFSILAAASARTQLARAVAFAGACAVGAGLLATFSRASWVAVLLAPAILFTARAGRTAARVWLCALLFVVLTDVALGGVIQARILSTIGDWVVEQRAALTLAGIVMFAAHPVTGVGPGGFAASLESYGPRISWLWDYLPTAQNGFVQMAAETGVIGLAALVFFLGFILRRLIRGARRTVHARAHATAHTPSAPGLTLEHAALWSFATAVLLAFNEWIFAHGIAQLIVLSAAIGLSAPSGDGDAVRP